MRSSAATVQGTRIIVILHVSCLKQEQAPQDKLFHDSMPACVGAIELVEAK